MLHNHDNAAVEDGYNRNLCSRYVFSFYYHQIRHGITNDDTICCYASTLAASCLMFSRRSQTKHDNSMTGTSSQ